jgi:hypothetical protein
MAEMRQLCEAAATGVRRRQHDRPAALAKGSQMPLRSRYQTCLLGIALTLAAAPAHAYLDPGTGSMILQVLLGGIAGVALAGKFYWRRFLVMIGLRSETYPEQPTEQRKPPADR